MHERTQVFTSAQGGLRNLGGEGEGTHHILAADRPMRRGSAPTSEMLDQKRNAHVRETRSKQ